MATQYQPKKTRVFHYSTTLFDYDILALKDKITEHTQRQIIISSTTQTHEKNTGYRITINGRKLVAYISRFEFPTSFGTESPTNPLKTRNIKIRIYAANLAEQPDYQTKENYIAEIKTGFNHLYQPDGTIHIELQHTPEFNEKDFTETVRLLFSNDIHKENNQP